ncbi:MAG: hypothetical protein BGO75_08575 [Burkholderiales bacterium 68-20]|nr:MAG: hypothetical protein BGO75_08575 [Burkholderiales bacterium 68-20]
MDWARSGADQAADFFLERFLACFLPALWALAALASGAGAAAAGAADTAGARGAAGAAGACANAPAQSRPVVRSARSFFIYAISLTD